MGVEDEGWFRIFDVTVRLLLKERDLMRLPPTPTVRSRLAKLARDSGRREVRTARGSRLTPRAVMALDATCQRLLYAVAMDAVRRARAQQRDVGVATVVSRAHIIDARPTTPGAARDSKPSRVARELNPLLVWPSTHVPTAT